MGIAFRLMAVEGPMARSVADLCLDGAAVIEAACGAITPIDPVRR
jgi:hypothetical protein